MRGLLSTHGVSVPAQSDQIVRAWVDVRQPEDFPADAFDQASTIDLIAWESGTEYPDPVSLIAGLVDVAWLGAENHAELERLGGLSGRSGLTPRVAFADRIVDEEAHL